MCLSSKRIEYCIGANLVDIQLAIVLAQSLQHFELEFLVKMVSVALISIFCSIVHIVEHLRHLRNTTVEGRELRAKPPISS